MNPPDDILVSVFDCLDDGIVITEAAENLDGIFITYCNRAFLKLTKFSRKDLQPPFSLSSFLAHNDRQWLLQSRSSFSQTNRKFSRDVIFTNKKGEEITARWTISKIKTTTNNRTLLCHTVVDITNLRRLEENIRQTQKMEAIGQLASGIAHDFNNIIAIITGLAEIIIIKETSNSKACSYARKILQTSKRGANIVSKLMAFSRNQPPTSEFINLPEALDQIKPFAEQLLPATLELKIRCESNLPPVPLTLTQFEQIILNLCTNASDAIGKVKGSISIHVSIQEITAKQGAELLQPIAPGDYVCIEFTDTGNGIKETIKEKIFDPFFTTKEPGKGTGLGLSTIYGIIKQANGSLSVTSKLNRGTTFHFYLPPYIARYVDHRQYNKSLLIIGDAQKSVLSHLTRNDPFVVIKSSQPSLQKIVQNALKLKRITVKQDPDDQLDLLSLWSCDERFKVAILDYSHLKNNYPKLFPQMLFSTPKCPLILILDKNVTDFNGKPLAENIFIYHPPVPLRHLIHQVESFC